MGSRCLCRLPENFLRLVALPAHHHRPDNAGGLVGQCDRSNFGRFAHTVALQSFHRHWLIPPETSNSARPTASFRSVLLIRSDSTARACLASITTTGKPSARNA